MPDYQQKAYDELYRNTFRQLLQYAIRFVEWESAEDLVHDVFIKIWEEKERLALDESLRPYLFRAVRNRCIDHIERLKTRQDDTARIEYEMLCDQSDFYRFHERLFTDERIREINRRIEQLPPTMRSIFKESYFDGRKSADIARRRGISVRTVEHQLYKALRNLRETFQGRQDTSLLTARQKDGSEG